MKENKTFRTMLDKMNQAEVKEVILTEEYWTESNR